LERKGGGDVMVTKKDVIIVLMTVCISALLFVTLPTRSQTSSYDPWADVSGPTVGQSDGVINMRDIAYEVALFNTFGDTTKNASITNLPLDENGNLKVTVVDKPLLYHTTTDYISIVDDSDGIFAQVVDMPFSFNSIGSNVNVTRISFLWTWHGDQGYNYQWADNVNLTLNNAVTQEVAELYGQADGSQSIQFNQTEWVTAIIPYKTNFITFTYTLRPWLWVTRLYMIIEYEYLA
jgi:hypothetical protein